MQLSHAFPVKVMVFNEPTLVSQAGFVPIRSVKESSRNSVVDGQVI